MKIKELIDLGFHINFVSAEESGGEPYFYTGIEVGDMYMASRSVSMGFDENSKKYYENYLNSDVEVFIFDHELPLSEEVIKALVNQKIVTHE